MALGQITITPIRSTAVNFTLAYFEEKIGFVTHKPYPLPKYQALIWPYQLDVWFSLIASVIIFGLLYYLLVSKLSVFDYISLEVSYIYTFMTLLMQGEYNQSIFLL